MKILLITYYFSPCGAIGAKRWNGFFNLSKDTKDIDFTVLTANWKGKKVNESNINYLGEEIEYQAPKSINKEYSFGDTIKHPSIMIRSIDRSIFSQWKSEVINWINLNKNLKFDLVISSFGPSLCIYLGNYAKKIYKVPYVLDLRDLVSIQGQKKKLPFFHYIDKKIDRFLTRNVDLFLTVSPTCKDKAINFYNKKVDIIYNGLEDPLKYSEKEIGIELDKKSINIFYSGTLGTTRNPYKIIKIINEYLYHNQNIKVNIIFASQDNPYEFLIEKELFVDIEWVGYISKEKVIEYRNKCDALLLLEDLSEEGNENLTGKLFEYLSSTKPIVVSCNKKSDIVRLINETNSGFLIENINDFEVFLNDKKFLNIEKINEYSREFQFKKLIKVLKNV